MKNSIARLTVLAALAGLFCLPATAADTTSGQFVLDGKALAPTSVAAFRVRSQDNPREFSTYVMLSTKPMDLEALAQSDDAYATAINDAAVMNDDHLAFGINADGTVSMNAHVGGTQYIDSSGYIMGSKGSLVADCTTSTIERVACSVRNAKPVKAMGGDTWTVDVKFDSAVIPRASGTPLPTDGGEPGKAFDAFIEAARGDDLPKIIALLSPRQAEMFSHDYNTPEENLKSAKQMFEFTLPKKHKVTGGELRGEDKALLEVEGVPFEGSRVLYIVSMERADGRWGYVFSQWAGKLD